MIISTDSNTTMPTLKQRKYSKSSTPARGSSNGADVARARPDPPQQQRQPPQQPAPQASQQAGGQALEQQGVIDAMVELQNHGADLGLPPPGQIEPWPPLLGARPPSVQQPLPPPPPPQQQRQQPSLETLLLSIARMERCSRCHLRTWSFVQDPVTGGELSFQYLFMPWPSPLSVLSNILSLLSLYSMPLAGFISSKALRTNALTIPNEVYVSSMFWSWIYAIFF